MDYANFELEIGSAGDGRYQLNVRSPAGEIKAAVALQVPTDLIELSRWFHRPETVRGAQAETRGLLRQQSTLGIRDSLDAARRLGEGLFNAVFDERQAYGRYCASIGGLAPGRGLRVRLLIESPELAAVPWEFMADSSKGPPGFLALSSETPITRYLKVGEPPLPLRVEPPLRILGMIASPSDRDWLDTEREKARMMKALDTRIESGAVEIQWVEGDSWDALQVALGRGPWHVFHFIGHGGFDETLGEGFLALCNADGTMRRARASALATLLRLNRDSLRLVVLNSCDGARTSDVDSFSSTSGAIIGSGVPAVVSMQYEISDQAALTFSRIFYNSLAGEKPIDLAVTEARVAINGESEAGTIEWATPVLHLRSPDGQLFSFDAASRVLGPSGPVPRAGTSPRYTGQTAVPARPPKRRVASEATRGLDVLRQKVREAWIDGVLARDLELAPLIDLGMEQLGGLVATEGGDASPGSDAVAITSAQSIRDVYREQSGSLLIVGEPGAGKTTAMLSIARDLLDRADQDFQAPIPVVLNLSTWSARARPLDQWIADELAAKYAVPADVAKVWTSIDRLIPFLDGLDEVPDGRRAACVDAINRFQDTTNLAALVVACRYKEYVDQPSRLTLNAAIRLRRLTPDQVRLTARGEPRLAAFARALDLDSGLLVEAQSPLMLSIMIQAYRDLPLDQVQHESSDSADARRTKVWAAYVARKLRLAGALP